MGGRPSSSREITLSAPFSKRFSSILKAAELQSWSLIPKERFTFYDSRLTVEIRLPFNLRRPSIHVKTTQEEFENAIYFYG